MEMKNLVNYLVEKEKIKPEFSEISPSIDDNYIRVKYLYCGICGGDHAKYLGIRNWYPITLGHEFIGQIIKVGKNVSEHFCDGDHVISDFNFRCGKCQYCLTKKSHLCDQNDIELFSNRAFSLYGDIHYNYLTKVEMNDEYLHRGVLMEPLSCVIHACNHYDLNDINNILIYGTGSIGALCAFYLSYICKKNVTVYDINPDKMKAVCDAFSCKAIYDEAEYDLIFEATSDLGGLSDVIQLSKKNGKLCSMSHLFGLNTSKIYESLQKREIKIVFPLRNGEKENMSRAAEYIINDWDFDSLLEIHELADINQAFLNKNNSNYPKQAFKIF